MKHLLPSLLLLTIPFSASAGDWPNWRGPNGNGVSEGTGYPVSWTPDDVKWSYELPGLGASTPAVFGGDIFLTYTKDGKNIAACVDMQGKEKWSKELNECVDGKHTDGTGANPSPVVSEAGVFVYYKSGDFGCFSHDGELKWSINASEEFAKVTKETLWWDLGTSPVLTSNAVVLTTMHTGPSYLAALDQETGKLLWKHDRITDAPKEAAQSYTTPIVTKNPDGREVIIVTGADYVTCHDAADGKELWRVGSLNPDNNGFFRSISSSVSGSGTVIAPYARGGSLTAIKMGGSGNVTDSHVLWSNNETAADVPTPTIVGDRVFVLRDSKGARGTVDCLDLKTGKEIWSGQVEKHRAVYRSSPVYADGKLYLTRQDGTVFVLNADGDSFELLATNRFSAESRETTNATPVFVDGKILIRSAARLYLLGS